MTWSDRANVPTSLDSSFTLDAEQLHRRKAESARRVHAGQIPLIRAVGFVILCAMAALQDLQSGLPMPSPALWALVALNLGYSVFSWVILQLAYGRTGRLDLSLVFLHVDVVLWLFTLHHLEQAYLFYAYLLLVRVADQVGFSFKRAFYFNHVVVAIYLAYSRLLTLDDPVAWGERLTIATVMYLVGTYLAFTGFVTERLRNRTRTAVRTARSLVDQLAQQTLSLIHI